MIARKELDEGASENAPVLEENRITRRPRIARRHDDGSRRRRLLGSLRGERSARRGFCARPFGECGNGDDLERGEERSAKRSGELAHGARMSNLRAATSPRETPYFEEASPA